MKSDRTVPPRSSWTALDTVSVVLITALAGAVRWVGIGHPGAIVFDEHYAQDACLFAFGSGGNCPNTAELGYVHPPLAKWLIAAGIRMFGFSPTAWRLAPLVAGTLSVAALYLLARRLSGSTIAASLAAGLLAFDFLHFVMSRTAMLDIFVVFFGIASFLFVVYDSDRPSVAESNPRISFATRMMQRRWLLAAGIAGGAAMASKWSGGYLFGGAVLFALIHAAARSRAGNSRALSADGAVLVACLVVVPILVYMVSYTGRLNATLLTWPWNRDSWVRALVAQHYTMVEHHTGSLFVHPYTSPAWSWPLIKRPVLFHFRPRDTGLQEILAIGNPVVWWIALSAVASAAWQTWRTPSVQSAGTVAIIGFAAAYLPWFVITRQEAFLYYFLPAVPFMYLAVAHLVAGMSMRSLRVAVSTTLMLASIGMFSFFWPVLAGRPVSYEQWERRMLFDDCGAGASTTRKRPVTKPQPPPAGWCWV